MTPAAVDLSDFALWRNGFPDELFAELRRARPLFRHELTPGVAETVRREFWGTTKHRHAVRLHRDAESFTAVDGPLIQPVGLFSSYPTIVNMDPPALNKRRKLISHAFNPRAIAKLEDANGAGGKHGHECTLIVTEGDSAKALAVAGLAVVGRDRCVRAYILRL